MSRWGTHTHHCRNKNAGCKSTWECENRHLEHNYDGFPEVVCSLNPENGIECEDCDTSRCSDCGSVLNVEQHDNDCAKATAV